MQVETRIRNARAEHYIRTSERQRQRRIDDAYDVAILFAFAALKLSIVTFAIGGIS